MSEIVEYRSHSQRFKPRQALEKAPSLHILFFITLGFILLAYPAPLFSAILELEQVTQSAIRNYPVLQAALKDVTRAEGEALGARGGFDPVFKFDGTRTFVGYYKNTYFEAAVEQPTPFWGAKATGGYRYGQGDFPAYDGRLATFNGGELRAAIEVPLLRNGAIDERRGKIQTTEKSLEMAQENLMNQKIEIERQATYRYWDWLAAGKKLVIAKNMLQIAEDRDEALSSRVKHGDVPVFDREDNRRGIIQRQSAVVAAERALQKAALELSLFYRNGSGMTLVPETSELPSEFPEEVHSEVPIGKPHSELVERNPELKRLRSQIELTQVDLTIAGNQVLPKLDFKLGIFSDLGASNIDKFLVPTDYPQEIKVSLSFEMPLLLRSPRGRLESSQANLEKLNAQLVLQRDRIRTNITDAEQAMNQSFKRVEFGKQELILAKKLEVGERVRFFHGDSNLLFVNIREQNTREAALREVDALLEFHRAKAEYRAASAQMAK